MAWHGRVVGRRREAVIGSQRRHVCQTPFGSSSICHEEELALEVAVRIDGPELAAPAIPACVELATPHELLRADVEDVGEVRLDGDLHRDPDRAARVAGEVVVLVHATGDRLVDPQAERLARDPALGIEQLGVRVLEPRGVELDGRRVEQDRPLAVEEEVVVADESRVAGEEAFVCVLADAAVRLAHDESVVPVDRDGRGADLDWQAHGWCPPPPGKRGASRRHVSPDPAGRRPTLRPVVSRRRNDRALGHYNRGSGRRLGTPSRGRHEADLRGGRAQWRFFGTS